MNENYKYQPGKSILGGRYEGACMPSENYAGEAARRDPDVAVSLKELHQSVEDLTAAMIALGSRLAPVTRCEVANKTTPEGLTRPGNCSVSSQIIEATNKIRDIGRAVSDQINLLEI